MLQVSPQDLNAMHLISSSCIYFASWIHCDTFMTKSYSSFVMHLMGNSLSVNQKTKGITDIEHKYAFGVALFYMQVSIFSDYVC
jgi:hypothetical protein